MMTPEQFVAWLQGYNEAEPATPLPETVRQKLKTVWPASTGVSTGGVVSSWPIVPNSMEYGVKFAPSPYDIETTSGTPKRAV